MVSNIGTVLYRKPGKAAVALAACPVVEVARLP